MAQQDKGIMALMGTGAGDQAMGATPEDPPIDMARFRRDAYPVFKESVREVSPEAFGEMQATLSSELAAAGELDAEAIEQLLEIIDYINENPEEYAQVREALISAGIIDAADFPPEMDVEYFATMEVVLQEALMKQQEQVAEMVQGPVEMMPPQGFAKGGIAEAARLVASKGRYGDTMLAHITPSEARLLKSRGGSGTINPETGLPEFFLKKLFKGVKNIVRGVVKAVKGIVKKIVSSPIGRIVATVGLSMIGVPPPLASALVTKAAGGSWKDALKSAAVSFLGGPSSPIASTVQRFTPFLNNLSPGVAAGIRSGLTSTAASLLTGSNLRDAVTSGLTSGLMTGLQTRQPTAPVSDASPLTPEQILRGEGMAPAAGSPSPADAALLPSTAIPAATAAPTAAQAPVDPIGNIIRQDIAANTPAVEAPPIGVRPTLMQSLGQTARGVGDVLTGDFSEGFSNIGTGLKDTFMPRSMSTDELSKRAIQIQRNLSDRGASVSFTEALKMAGKEQPDLLRTYGPAVAGGLGVMALTGGFEQKPLGESPFSEQMRAPIDVPPSLQRPIQNLPGVRYDAQGNIIGSQEWSPYEGMGSAETPTAGIMSLSGAPAPIAPPLYTPPLSAPTTAQGPIPQPYNTSGLYDPYMFQRFLQQPRRFNLGGVASLAQGGYPRRIGQISGPGTETSDDIPAMLSDGEFVMTARAVRGAGNGSRREGAKKMYALMHQLEQNAARG